MHACIREMEKLWKALIIMLLLAVAFVNVSFTSPDPDARFAVVPSGVVARDGETFSVKVYGYELEDVFAWQVFMEWDPTVLDATGVVVHDDLLDRPREGPWGVLTKDAPYATTNPKWPKILNVTDGTQFYANLRVIIKDDSNTETNVVSDVSGEMLTMADDLANTYTVAANAICIPDPDFTPSAKISNSETMSYVMAGETTNGDTMGADAEVALLLTITFLVEIPNAETILNITTGDPVAGPLTFYQRAFDYPAKHTPIRENGYYTYPWPEDINGDGWVDIFDLSSVAIHMDETGSPGWIPEDLSGSSGEPDGVIDIWDLTLVCYKYGQYVG